MNVASCKITANDRVFMQVLNLKNVCPQPMPNNDKKVKVNNQKLNSKCQAGTTAPQGTNAEGNNVQQHLHKYQCCVFVPFSKRNILGVCQPPTMPVTAANCQTNLLITNSRSGNNIMIKKKITVKMQGLSNSVKQKIVEVYFLGIKIYKSTLQVDE